MKTTKHLVMGFLAFSGLLVSGCLTNDGPSKQQQNAQLSIQLKVADVNNLTKSGLGKASTIKLRKLVVTLTSSIVTDSVVRDTITEGEHGFDSVATTAQSISGMTYSVKSLRNWTIVVKTLDANDSVIHTATSVQNAILIGEIRPVVIDLTSKYVMYVAKFTLPDSISSATAGTIKEKLDVNRLVMTVDGKVVRDSSQTYFAASPTSDYLNFDYIRADTTHTIKLQVFGHMNNWPDSLPLYSDSISIASTDSTYHPVLPWTGPGSDKDPNCVSSPANCGSQIGLTVNIGKVGVVEIAPVTDGTVLSKR